MKHITDDHEGDLLIDGYVGVSGVVTGSVEVAAGRFTLTGAVLEDVIVHDGLANIYGIVHGDIVNHGGRVIVAGEVGGALRGSQEVELSSSAVVGRPIAAPVFEPTDPLPEQSDAPPERGPSTTTSLRSNPDDAHAKWRQFSRGPVSRRLVLPWKYAPASPNPRLRLRRWWRFVSALLVFVVAFGFLYLAMYFGSRNHVPEAVDEPQPLNVYAET